MLTAILSAILSVFAPTNVPLHDPCPEYVACMTTPDCGSDSDMARIWEACGWDDAAEDFDPETP